MQGAQSERISRDPWKAVEAPGLTSLTYQELKVAGTQSLCGTCANAPRPQDFVSSMDVCRCLGQQYSLLWLASSCFRTAVQSLGLSVPGRALGVPPKQSARLLSAIVGRWVTELGSWGVGEVADSHLLEEWLLPGHNGPLCPGAERGPL